MRVGLPLVFEDDDADLLDLCDLGVLRRFHAIDALTEMLRAGRRRVDFCERLCLAQAQACY